MVSNNITHFIAGQFLMTKMNEHIMDFYISTVFKLNGVKFRHFPRLLNSAYQHTHTGARQLIGDGLNGCDELRVLGMLPWLSSCSLGAQQTISLNFSA